MFYAGMHISVDVVYFKIYGINNKYEEFTKKFCYHSVVAKFRSNITDKVGSILLKYTFSLSVNK